MTEHNRTALYFTWRVVFQAGVFLMVVVGGSIALARTENLLATLHEMRLLLHGVEAQHEVLAKTTQDVKQTTKALQQVTTSTNTLVHESLEAVEHHADLTKEHTAMYQHVLPLFQDVVARQQVILQELAALRTRLDALGAVPAPAPGP